MNHYCNGDLNDNTTIRNNIFILKDFLDNLDWQNLKNICMNDNTNSNYLKKSMSILYFLKMYK